MENLRYEAIFWDFHGTFTSNRGRLAHALNNTYMEVLRRPITKPEFQTVYDRPLGESVTDAISKLLNGGLSEEEKVLLIEVYRQHVDRVFIPKHHYLLRRMHGMGALSVIVTNGQEQVVRDVIAGWGLAHYLEEIYGKGGGARLERVPKKPSLEVIDFVIEDLRSRGHRIRRERTLMVGDYQDDIIAANQAGLHTAFIVTGPNQKPEYYAMRPTYALLDSPNLQPASDWLGRENVHLVSELPKIVTGEL